VGAIAAALLPLRWFSADTPACRRLEGFLESDFPPCFFLFWTKRTPLRRPLPREIRWPAFYEGFYAEKIVAEIPPFWPSSPSSSVEVEVRLKAMAGRSFLPIFLLFEVVF